MRSVKALRNKFSSAPGAKAEGADYRSTLEKTTQHNKVN